MQQKVDEGRVLVFVIRGREIGIVANEAGGVEVVVMLFVFCDSAKNKKCQAKNYAEKEK